MEHKGTQTIKTERLLLRRVTAADAEQMYNNWGADPEVMRYLRMKPRKSVDECREKLEEWAKKYENDDYYFWGIEMKDGPLFGTVGAYMLHPDEEAAELGYCIGRAFWGSGYVAEALKGVFAYLFGEVRLNRIEAAHSVNNPASGRVMEKAGMTREGLCRQKYKAADGFQDSVIYGILREDYKTPLM
jgi:ribosomal-protein-alanine N-acetyltransferase